MREQSCIEWVDTLASKAPIPGGGSASALVGAIGTALGSMVGNLTTGKKKYADVEEEIQVLLQKSEELTNKFYVLVDKDMEAFKPLSEAYGLPSGSEEEKKSKDEVLQKALIDATFAPLEIMEACKEAIELLDSYSKKGSRLVVSDAGTGVIFCKSALQGAKLNVLINLKTMKDETLKASITERMHKAEEGLIIADAVYSYVEDQLK